MESILLRDLAVVISVAAATTLLCHRLRQPVVIGYLLAGLIIGPYTPPFTLIYDLHSIHTMAELGLVVLMFMLGLEFSLPKLRKVGTRSGLASVLEIFGMFALGFLVGHALGWDRHNSIYLGAILSISSTTIVVKVLTDLKLTQESFAQAVFGILIMEDIAAVVILTVLSGLGVRHENEGITVLRALIQVGFFVTLFLIIGLATIPRLLHWVGRFKSREILGLMAFGLCLSSALIAQRLGFSVAIGAFLIGAVIAASSEAESIESWIHPIRDLFSALFFVSAGLLIDPRVLWSIKGPVVLIAVITIVGQVLNGAIGSFVAGYSLKNSFKVGMTLAQIGEFSFVFASLGIRTGLGSDFLYPLAVGVSALTTIASPYLIRHSDHMVDLLMRWAPARLTRALEAYQTRRETQRENSRPTEVLSRYGWRLAMYAVLLAAGFLLTRAIDHAFALGTHARVITIGVWFAAWIVHLPLIHAVTGYINHFLLISMTELMVRTRAAGLFLKIPIQRTYDLMETFMWILIAVIWARQPAMVSGEGPDLYVLLGVMAVAVIGLRKGVQRVYSRLETLLDEIFGLATSEPLRRAALALESPQSLLNESIQRVLLKRSSAAVHQSLRALGLREQTGASVIAVYRHGKLNPNPSPETQLLPNDILVLLGNSDQCRRAQRYLLG